MNKHNINTSAQESSERCGKKYRITLEAERLMFIPCLFLTPAGDGMVASWLDRHSDYDGGLWDYFIIPDGAADSIIQPCSIDAPLAGYIAPAGDQKYHMIVPGNYFEGDVSADAAGIISTMMILNWMSWQVADMGPEYGVFCKRLVQRQDALKDYISAVNHPERALIWRAID
jgi:hypothetical protein